MEKNYIFRVLRFSGFREIIMILRIRFENHQSFALFSLFRFGFALPLLLTLPVVWVIVLCQFNEGPFLSLRIGRLIFPRTLSENFHPRKVEATQKHIECVSLDDTQTLYVNELTKANP